MNSQREKAQSYLFDLAKRGDWPTALLFVGATREEREELVQWVCTLIAPAQIIRLSLRGEETALSVDDVRDALSTISRSAFYGGWRVVACSCPELLSESAGNALLKSIEEPPPHTIFIFSSDLRERIRATVVSRFMLIRLPLPIFLADDTPWQALIASPVWRQMTYGGMQGDAMDLDEVEQMVYAGLHGASRRDEYRRLAGIADCISFVRMSRSLSSSHTVHDRIALSSDDVNTHEQ